MYHDEVVDESYEANFPQEEEKFYLPPRYDILNAIYDAVCDVFYSLDYEGLEDEAYKRQTKLANHLAELEFELSNWIETVACMEAGFYEGFVDDDPEVECYQRCEEREYDNVRDVW